ncbi:NADPH:quinone reductase-like Zn-dependent oxidoreductase [Naumannella cuiyingiana]|uniref:NADPH:quinone reductase-like Zn-dependent oxidoreductase n=1 Tax=Naumannella cuiyingiana TaxID=1347891 RepID=A0A7Z0D6Q8_9ACTN|nr:NADP-dependent oxidoreductase [Naumannella cuiyingiana]NYI69766.1 NADPH:quinone reductase-like Zn-dependent oxidoreductase [Naumannella cuiyingiana]
MSNDEMMKAIRRERLGGPEVLRIASVAVPSVGPSQVLVRVEATSLNPTDWVHRRVAGFLGDGPKVLRWDVAGVVVRVGLGVTVHRVGDRVVGMLPYPFGHGAAAEYVRAPARALVSTPAVLASADAAAVPLVGLTAWQALVDTAGVQPTNRVLVHAAAGGVGHMAVQIAKAHGAYVIGTASASNHALVRDLGADEVIDYRTTRLVEAVENIDIALDTVGGDTAARSLQVTRSGGAIVSLSLNSTTPLGEIAQRRGVRHELMLVESDREGLTQLMRLVEAGRLRPVVDRQVALFGIDAVREAHVYGDAGHVAGKIILRAESAA